MAAEQAYRMKAEVGPGHRIELIAPELAEGERVDVFIVRQEPVRAGEAFLDLIDSFPVGPRSAATWEEVESNLKADREAWDR